MADPDSLDAGPSPSERELLALARASDRPVELSVEDRSGERVGHFLLKRKLGQGGMGVVYEAYDDALRRPIALKLLHPSALRSEGARKRLLREARAASAIEHPSVISVFEVSEIGDEVYIAMELVRGRTLAERLQREGMLPAKELIELFSTVCSALGVAHAKGVVHRDLKPENIMLDEQGRVRLLDFGLAKPTPLEGSASTSANVTEEGRIIGTPGYMSPEQASGLPVDARSDVFSLGVVLYEMATGVPPFAGATRVETLVSIMRDEPLPVVRRNPRVPPALSRVIERCLQKEANRRYRDATELEVELRRIRPFERSLSVWRAVAAAGAAAAVAAGAWAFHSVTRTPENPIALAAQAKAPALPTAPKPPSPELAVPSVVPVADNPNPVLPPPVATAAASPGARKDARPKRAISHRPAPLPSARESGPEPAPLGDPLATQK
jgi:eukaryotic-like serine/threonine-protein kinase